MRRRNPRHPEARTTARLRALGFGEDTLIAHRANFSELATLLPQTGGGFDFVLADLGVSSMQIDNPAQDLHLAQHPGAGARPGPARG